MAKTYTTPGSATAGDVYTATAHNVIVTDVSNLIVPPACQLVRTTNLTSYTSATDISWTTTAAFDTDGMFAAGSPTRITFNTTGLYLITATVLLTGSATITSVSLDIHKNGSIFLRQTSPNTTTAGYINISLVSSFTATDYLTAQVSITGGSAYVISGAATETNAQSRFGAMWVGRTS